MALINVSLNVDKIDKSKVIEGKKGRYVNLTIATYDQTDDYGNNVSVYHSQSKEERESGASKTYVANGQVVAAGEVVKAVKQEPQPIKKKVADDVEWDFL